MGVGRTGIGMTMGYGYGKNYAMVGVNGAT